MRRTLANVRKDMVATKAADDRNPKIPNPKGLSLRSTQTAGVAASKRAMSSATVHVNPRWLPGSPSPMSLGLHVARNNLIGAAYALSHDFNSRPNRIDPRCRGRSCTTASCTSKVFPSSSPPTTCLFITTDAPIADEENNIIVLPHLNFKT